MCVSILGSKSFSSVLAAGHSRLIWHQFLPMLLSLPDFRIAYLFYYLIIYIFLFITFLSFYYRFVPYFKYLSN